MAAELSIGQRRYRIVAQARESDWVAFAERVETGERFGMECAGTTEADAVGRLTQWLDWQHEHTVALEALQQAERAYHRTITENAFAGATEDPASAELQQDALDAIDGARRRLDEIRARRPM